MKKVFTEEEKKQIYELYKNCNGVAKIGKMLHTSPKKVKKALLEMGIDIADPNKSIGISIKPIGYWKIRINNENAAKQCRNRSEFSKKFESAYKIAIKNGWIDEYQEKYFSTIPKFKSLELAIHLIYAYEVLETNSVYIGRTTDIKRRNLTHRSQSQNDGIYKHCFENNIKIPNPKILEEGLTGYESQEAEDKWIKTYKSEGWNIINKAKTGKGIGSLGAVEPKWTYETCKEAAKLCSSKQDFKKKFCGAHNASRANGWINEFFPVNAKKNDGCFDTLEGCREAAKTFKTILQIRNEYPFLYQKISKNKWTEQIREYIGEDEKARKEYSNFRKGLKYFEFNKTWYYPIDLMNCREVEFFNLINRKKDGIEAIIDKKSEFNNKLYVRVDSIKTIFMLVNVKENGSFKTLQKNCFLSKILDYCNLIGYRIIIVYDSELVYSKNIIKNKILYYLGIKKNIAKTIYARNCEIHEIFGTDVEDFLNKYHIQGYVPSTIYFGAYYNSELVAVMTFKNGGINTSDWVLNRFAVSDKYICCGIGGKLFKHFITNYNISKVVSFADRRWGIKKDNVYTKIGFIFDSISPLSYKYFNANSNGIPQLEHKLIVMNKNKFSHKISEKQMAKELGYDRIWDCGLIKYVWEK